MNVRVPVPASNGLRFVAYLFDNFAWILAIAVLPPAVGLFTLVAWIGWWVVLSTQGMSPGKKVAGLVCIDVHSGRPASFGKMLARDFLAKGLLGMVTFGLTGLVGTIQILGSNDRRALWDKMADTLVVERSTFQPVGAAAAESTVPAPPSPPPPPPTTADEAASVRFSSPLPNSKGPAAPLAHPPGTLPVADMSGLDDQTIARGAVAPVRAGATAQWSISSSWGLRRVVAAGTVLLVGRDPEAGAGAGHVELERTPPEARAISKTHCALRVGQMVEVEDRGSRNGTIIEPPGGRAVALRRDDPVPVVAGTRVVLGDQWIRIDAGG